MQTRLQSVLSRLPTIPVPEEANIGVSKRISMYGAYETWEPVWQRYWKRRKDGVKQRYWKKTSRMKRAPGDGRFEFHGPGRDLMRAVIQVKRRDQVPKGYVEVAADEFLLNTEEYVAEGYWIDLIIDS